MERNKMSVLGGLQIRTGEKPASFRTEKNLILLALMAAVRRGINRYDLALLLWPDAREEQGRQNIRQAIYTIRKILEDYHPTSASLEVDGDLLRLNEECWEVDLWEFSTQAQKIRDHHISGDPLCPACGLLAEETLSRYTGDFLSDLSIDSPKLEEWIGRERGKYRRMADTLFQLLWEKYMSRLEFKEARALLERYPGLVNGDAEDPEWVLSQAWCDFLAGKKEAAIESLRVAEQDLLIPPELRERLLAHKIPNTYHLEPIRTQLKGRDRDVQSILHTLSAGKRLVSVIGREGYGKTTLVQHVGSLLLSQHRRFVFLVDLSKIQLPDALPVAICLELGLSLQANLSPLDLLLKTVPELEAVLILDACENIKEAVATLVVQLLQAGPGLSILVTSRVPIQVQSAEGYAMLLSPARNRVQAEFEEIPLEPLEPLLAARLLIELFQRQDPEFNVNNESVPLITDLVVRVKGVPLAIEMVAGQASESGLQSAYQSLTRTLQTLDDTKVNQLTAEIVRWRLAQLTAQERTVLQALSLFVSGAAWESLMRVLEREKIGASLLDQLKDRLLMDYNPKSSRVRLHDLTRELCLSDLSKSDPYRDLCAGYLDWSKDFVERWTPQLEAAEGLTALQHLVLERENIERAIDLALENQAIEHAYVISAKLFRFWLILGNVHAGLELYERVLSHQYHGQPKLGVLIGAGALAISKGDLQQGANYYESGLQTALVLQDQTAIVQMRQNLAVVYARTRQYEKAESEFLLVLEAATSSGDQRLQSSCLINLANCLVASGSQDLERIKRLYEESLELLKPLDDLIRTATVWNNLGVLLHKMGDLHAAESAYQESLTIKSRLQDRLGTASTLTNIGLIQAKLGRMTDGLISFKNALQILIELHLPLAVPGLPGNLARCLSLMGRYPESAMLFGASEQLYQELGNKSVHDEEERKIWMDELKHAMGKTAFQKKYTKGGKISGLEVLKFAQEIIESDDARETDI